MYRKELNERSPLRLFESSIHGGLGRGNIGLAVGRHGVGKSAFLVGVALDDLMRGRKVLHVALDKSVEKVREYYDEIFAELVRTANLEDAARERLEMERNRNIHTYIHHSFSVARLKEGITFLKEYAHFSPDLVVIDDYDFDKATTGMIEELRQVARELNAEMWMAAAIHREAARDARGIPEPISRLDGPISVIVSMAHDGKTVRLSLLKDHDNPAVSETSVALDPTTMLLMRE